jgi:hypothetical protein
VEHDEEGQKARRVLVDVPAEDAGQDDGMAEAADRKELGDSVIP